MKKFSIIGKSYPIKEGWEKVTGELQYCDDLPFHNLLHAKILRSPYSHARITNIDTSRAKELPGVKAVVAGKDTLGIKYGHLIQDQEVLVTDKVRFIGDEVAAVAAESEEIALEALKLIHVEYEELPAVLCPEEAINEESQLIFDSGNIAKTIKINRGAVEEAFNSADQTFEDKVETPLQFHGYLEPNICVAKFSKDKKLTVWGPCQVPFETRNTLAKVFDLPVRDVKFIQTPVGGGFGGKMEQKLFEISALLALQTNGRPVRLAYTREEEFLCGQPRVPMKFYLQTAFKSDGTILGKKTKIIADNSAFSLQAPGLFGAASTRIDCLYRINNVDTEAHLVYTNNIPTSSFRGYGNLQMHYAFETHLDTVAHKLELDPADIRLKNAIQTGDSTVHGWKIKSSGLSECIKKAVEVTDWKTKRVNKKEGYGIGMACCIHVAGNRAVFPHFDGSSAVVKIDETAAVQVYIGETDLGQGAKTAMSQIAAEVLGLDYDRISVHNVDTSISPFSVGTYADRVTNLAGNAVILAAQDAKRKLLTIIAENKMVKYEDLEIKDNIVTCKSKIELQLPIEDAIKEACYALAGGHIIGEGSYKPEGLELPDSSYYGNITSLQDFAVHVAEIEVDKITGKVKVLKMTCVSDAGTVINPNLFEGQFEGGAAQGLGLALVENAARKDGQVLNARLMDYGLPTAMDVPDIDVYLEEHSASASPGPFGAKSGGEPAIIPAAPAIANAIYHAIGMRVDKIPVLPEEIKDFMNSK